jgi:stringent starvation protein B
MKSSKPYFLEATYRWLIDNHRDPHVLIDAFAPGVMIPDACHVDDDHCVLFNIGPEAVSELVLGDDTVSFLASFNQVVHTINFPLSAVRAIYCVDNGRGMFFDDLDEEEWEEDEAFDAPQKSPKKDNPFRLVEKNNESD